MSVVRRALTIDTTLCMDALGVGFMQWATRTLKRDTDVIITLDPDMGRHISKHVGIKCKENGISK